MCQPVVMDYKLELVIIPVADVDRAKEFYLERAGFRLDVDQRAGQSWRRSTMTTRAGLGSEVAAGLAAEGPAVPHRNTDEFSLRHSFYLQDAVERGC